MRRLASFYFITIIGSIASAQSINLHGTVTDAGNRPVVGAVVALVDRKLGAVTDTSGAYLITNESRAVDFRPQARFAGRVWLSHGCLSINLSMSSAVRIELFDSRGHSLQGVVNRALSAGDYRFDLVKSRLAAQVVFIRVSIDGRTSTFRYFPLRNESRTAASSSPATWGREGLVKAQTGAKTLRFSGLGYKSKEAPISSYTEEVNTVLEASQPFGIFRVVAEKGDNYPYFWGRVADGPSPPQYYDNFKEVMKSGPCRLYKRVFPHCEPDCGDFATCVGDDSCQPHPNAMNVGTVTVSGLTLNNSDTARAFSIEPVGAYYYSTGWDITLKSPPCNEGDLVTLAASGSSSARAFTLRARGVSPLVVPMDSIDLTGSRPAVVTWVPPAKPGNSTIVVEVYLSSESGNYGRMECDCEDNGSLTMPAALVDSLRAYGLSGWPRIIITRQSSSAINAGIGAQFLIESTVWKWELKVPGVISCTDGIGCPEGTTCDFTAQMCR